MIIDHEIKTEMHNRRLEVLNKLRAIVHPLYVEQFAKILHYSWQENFEESQTLAEYLDLDPIDFCAIAENAEEFKELILIEREEIYIENMEDYA